MKLNCHCGSIRVNLQLFTEIPCLIGYAKIIPKSTLQRSSLTLKDYRSNSKLQSGIHDWGYNQTWCMYSIPFPIYSIWCIFAFYKHLIYKVWWIHTLPIILIQLLLIARIDPNTPNSLRSKTLENPLTRKFWHSATALLPSPFCRRKSYLMQPKAKLSPLTVKSNRSSHLQPASTAKSKTSNWLTPKVIVIFDRSSNTGRSAQDASGAAESIHYRARPNGLLHPNPFFPQRPLDKVNSRRMRSCARVYPYAN